MSTVTMEQTQNCSNRWAAREGTQRDRWAQTAPVSDDGCAPKPISIHIFPQAAGAQEPTTASGQQHSHVCQFIQSFLILQIFHFPKDLDTNRKDHGTSSPSYGVTSIPEQGRAQECPVGPAVPQQHSPQCHSGHSHSHPARCQSRLCGCL